MLNFKLRLVCDWIFTIFMGQTKLHTKNRQESKKKKKNMFKKCENEKVMDTCSGDEICTFVLHNHKVNRS